MHFDLPSSRSAGPDDGEPAFEQRRPNGAAADGASDGRDDVSWREEHFDVDAYDEGTGSFVSSEHHDVYTWTDEGRRLVVSERYSREDHHRRHHQQRHQEVLDGTNGPAASASNDHHDGYARNAGRGGGASSDSVETDPDLGFIHAVAAVVIQTAVRRFLAEIAFEERLYAVDVIQNAVCNWMARRQGTRYSYESGDVAYDDYDDGPYQPISREGGAGGPPPAPPQPKNSKRVMFIDDYNDFRDFAATEIQRYWRGWWARDGLEVDHFAATTIQRAFRGFWAREGLDVDRYCAVEIQRIVRGYLARMTYIYDVYRIIVVQSVVRRYLAFYTSAVRLANILYIQAIYRGYRVRAELHRFVSNGQEVAATFIQSQWRSYDAQMNYINTLADILIVQSVARRWLVLRRMRRMYGTRPKRESKSQSRATQNGVTVQAAARKNTHAVWQQHRLNVVSKPLHVQTAPQSSHPDGFDVFHRDSAGADEWYDGNKSETSNMLMNWRGRKSR